MNDKNLLIGFFIACLLIGFKGIQMAFSKRDKRFKLGYNPADMSMKGKIFTFLLVVIGILVYVFFIK
jgi:NAD/NADP transhydrogenase beta subunit